MSFIDDVLSAINFNQLIDALNETLYMSFTSVLLSGIFGLIIGVLLYCTRSDGLYPNRLINIIADLLINILRAIPFIILMFIMVPIAIFVTGSMLGASAAIPSLVFAASPFYARLVLIALIEVDKGVIEAAKAMGASNREIIFKVLIKEAMPALISGVGVTAISLISYSAMAGAIGGGGLGNLAYMYGYSRENNAVLYTTTALIVLIVFAVQAVTDLLVKKTDKR